MMALVDIAACDDAAECKSVENIITILTHYHYWNEEQLQQNPSHSDMDYSSLLQPDEQTEDNDDQVILPKLKTIHPQLTKSSASISCVAKYGSRISEFMDDSTYTEISLLNDFHHVFDKHCEDDREFEYIYIQLTKENEIKSKINKLNNII
eukprot:781228_1